MPLDNHDSHQLPPTGTYDRTEPSSGNVAQSIQVPQTQLEVSITQKAARTLKNVAKAATEASKVEPLNKQKCLDFQRRVRAQQAKKFSLKTSNPSRIKTTTACEMNIGNYVIVDPDLSPGKKSFGGRGWVHAIHHEGNKTFIDVEYISTEATRFESHIPLKRVVVHVPPQQVAQLNKYSVKTRYSSKTTTNPSSSTKHNNAPKKSNPIPREFTCLSDKLKHGRRYNMSKGWRRKELGLLEKKMIHPEFRQALCSDYRELQAYLKGLRDHGIKPDAAHTTKYLAYSWNVPRDTPREAYNRDVSGHSRYERQLEKVYGCTNPDNRRLKNVIVCRESAAAIYTPYKLFVDDCLRRFREDNPNHSRIDLSNLRKDCTFAWNKLPPSRRIEWEQESKAHDVRQPLIKDILIQKLQECPTRTFKELAEDINHWCSANTIHQWLSSIPTYGSYRERIIPLLTQQQKSRQLTFAKHFLNLWGLPPDRTKKILLVHYDEKWFHGLVARSNAKQCPQVGLFREVLSCYHKNYVNKAMVLAVTGIAFNEDLEKGGHGLKLNLIRVQAAKVAKKRVSECTVDQNGNRRYNGKTIRNKGDCYMVETNVTGSNCGTSENPKFSLLLCFQDDIFPGIHKLVDVGGEYEGYTVVIQGDNAGPHNDERFKRFVTDYCRKQGWLWEPQAPQMPYMNNLDLCVFPCMSKRHTSMCSKYSKSVASIEDIYRNAETVFSELSSSVVARGFVLAKRIAKLVIKNEGNNNFLNGADYHCLTREDFVDTNDGVIPACDDTIVCKPQTRNQVKLQSKRKKVGPKSETWYKRKCTKKVQAHRKITNAKYKQSLHTDITPFDGDLKVFAV